MTEKQVAVLARRNALPGRDLTWVEASLVIDAACGTSRGPQATTWLREQGVSPENAAKIVALAEQQLRTPSHGTDGDAVEARLETLEATGRPSSGAACELATVRRQQAAAAAE